MLLKEFTKKTFNDMTNLIIKEPVMLNYDEALFVVDALNGVVCSPETLIANLIGWIDMPLLIFHQH